MKLFSNVFVITLFVALSGTMVGCSSLGGNYFKPDRQTVNEEGQPQTITESRDIEKGIIKAFPDIPVPATHRVDLSESVIFTSPSQTVGKIVLKGNADSASLYRFFDISPDYGNIGPACGQQARRQHKRCTARPQEPGCLVL